MKKLKALLFISLFFQNPIFSQSITLTPGVEGNAQFPSLEYEKIISLANPKEGMIVYDKTYHCVRYYNGQRWLTSFQGNENIEPIVSAWVKKMTDYTYGDNEIFDFKSDANGNLYIMGNCHRPGETSSYYYLIKLDKALNVKWNLSYGDTGMWGTGLINIDNAGNVYTFVTFLYASYNGSYTQNQFFQKKINKDGVEIYSKIYRGWDNVPVATRANNLYMDSQSNSYLSYTSYTSYNGIYDKYLIKVSSDGNILWIKNINNCKAITNKNGDTYIFGSFTGSKNFDGVWISSSGEEDMVVGKYDSNGNLKWLNKFGGGQSDSIIDLKLDSYGNFHALGTFEGLVIFNGMGRNSYGKKDIVYLKGDPSGFLQISKQIGSDGNDLALSLDLNSSNKVLILAQVEGTTLNYGNGIINTNSSPSNFLANLNIDGSVYAINFVPITTSKFKIDINDNIYTYDAYGFSKFASDCTLIKKVNKSGGDFMIFGNSQDYYFSGTIESKLIIGSYEYSSLRPAAYISHWIE